MVYSNIKSEVANKAIQHVASRAERFNSGHFPFEIESIGIAGSSIRHENPKDIDFVIEAKTRSDVIEELIEFKRCLHSNLFKLGKLIFNSDGKMTVERLIGENEGLLLEMGFRKSWIDNWFPYIRISDIRLALSSGGSGFDEEKLVSGFLKNNWRGKRLEMHTVIFDTSGNRITMHRDIPFILIWNKNKGLIQPEESEFEKFLLAESIELRKDVAKINKTISEKDDSFNGCPPIYHPALKLIVEKEKQSTSLRTAFAELARVESEKIINTYMSDFSLALLPLCKVAEINTALRTELKCFSLIGNVYITLIDRHTRDKIRLLKSDNVSEQTIGLISKKLYKNRYYSKKDILKIIHAVGTDTIIDYIKEIKKLRGIVYGTT